MAADTATRVKASNQDDDIHQFLEVIKFIKAVKFYKKTVPGKLEWTNITQDEIHEIIEAYLIQIEDTIDVASILTSTTSAPEETTTIAHNNGFAKRSLTSFSCSKMPSVPITNKQMTDHTVMDQTPLQSQRGMMSALKNQKVKNATSIKGWCGFLNLASITQFLPRTFIAHFGYHIQARVLEHFE